MRDRLVQESIPVDPISDQPYRDQDAIRRSLSLPFKEETERVERKSRLGGGRWRGRDEEGDVKMRGTTEGHKDPDSECEGDKANR